MADITNDIWSEVDAENNSSGLLPGFPEGMNPGQVDDACRSLMSAIRRWYDRTNPTQTSTGSANAQALTYTVAPSEGYVVGDVYRFIPAFTNTAATTLNINTIGDVSILCHGEPLSGGEIIAGVICVVALDASTNFQLLNPQNRIFGDLQVLGNLSVGGLVSVAGELTADHIATVHDVFVGGDLHVTGDIDGTNEALTGTLTAADISVANDLTVSHDLTVTHNMTVSGDEHVTGKLFIGEKSINIGGIDVNILPSDVSFYISSTGSDSTGDGSIGNPWATANHAYTTVSANTNFGVHVVTIFMLPGTYTATSTFFGPAVGNWQLRSTTGIAADVTVQVTGFEQDGVHVNGTAQCSVAGITIGATGGYALVSSGPSQLTLVTVNVTQSNAHIVAYDGGTTVVAGNYAILGDAIYHLNCSHATLVASQAALPIVVSTSGTIATTAFARADDGGYIRMVGWGFGPGGVTGSCFSISTNAVIQTNGGDPATFLPGDTAGTSDSGGVFA